MSNAADASSPDSAGDYRLYVAHPEQYRVQIMAGAEREYCFQKAPGQDFYHLLVAGELYVDSGEEKLCLNCALRQGIVTHDRLFWQRKEG